MFKRILKILAICLAGFVVICGGAVGIYALQGGFKDKTVNILRLYMDDTTKADKTIYTLTDFTTKIDYEPLDATNTLLQVEVQDPMRPLDDNGIPYGDGILKGVPKTVRAGEEFTIHINKDSMGNNIGGVANLVFKPVDNEKNITDFTLKVVVDVVIPNNALYFAGNNSDEYSTTGKTITMGISNSEQNLYLKSNLVNAFYLQADNTNLKKAYISYVYKTLNGEYYDKKTDSFVKTEVVNTFDDLTTNHIYNSEEKAYNYYYEVPVTPSQSGTIKLTAKMHKTYEIEKEYNESGFDTFVFPAVQTNEAQLMLDKYNAFLNKYKAYIDNSDASYAFFKNYITAKGDVKLPYSAKAFEESKRYIFQSCESTINISAVNLDSITSTDNPLDYDVFSTHTYYLNSSNASIINQFGLDIKLDKDDVAQVDKEKSNLFSTLEVSPYIYIEKSEYASNSALWSNYNFKFGVERFENGKPVVSSNSFESETDVDNFGGIGYLILLDKKKTNGNGPYDDYITINPPSDILNKSWSISFNVPMTRRNTETTISSVTKALFLQFKVTGRDLNTGKEIVKDTYSRVYINYNEYEFKNTNEAKIAFSSSFKRMSINSNLQETNNPEGKLESLYNVNSLHEQAVKIDLSQSINNFGAVQYKNIMYFAEQSSNAIDNNTTKLATFGTYQFRYMPSGMSGTSDMIKLNDTENNLIGERLLNYGTMSESDYRMYAINASNEPVKIFAVVYLSDIKGNPIDLDGRPIVIDETNEAGDSPTLVVFAITDITNNGMPSVYVDNYVSNLNYYTVTKAGITIEDKEIKDNQENILGSFTIDAGSYVKRNQINEYIADDYKFSDDATKLIQDTLRLKLLKNNRFELVVSNFDLGSDGMPTTDGGNQSGTLTMSVKDFYGNNIEKSYNIDNSRNKQLALNEMCKNFDSNYYLYVQATNTSAVQKVTILREDNNDINSNVIAIKFEIVADGKSGTDSDYIYIKANDKTINGLGSCNDRVEWSVNKLEIQDVELDLQSTYQKLYSSYADTNSNKTQTFGEVTVNNGNSYTKTVYTLYSFGSSEVLQGSIQDNVGFRIINNLYDATNQKLNSELIDMSQLIYDDQYTDNVNNTNDSYFKDIKSYIDEYTLNTNKVGITYLNPEKVAMLERNLVFTQFGTDDNYIHVGNASFPIQNNSIKAGGREYAVEVDDETGLKKVTIYAGEYFPVVRGYTISGNDIVIILGQEFVISKTIIDGNTCEVIYNVEDKNQYQRQVIVNTKAKINGIDYKPSDYIFDGTTNNSNINSALEKTITTRDGKSLVTSATVSFVKGGTLKTTKQDSVSTPDEQGYYFYNNEIYVRDDNGNYYVNANGEFEIAGRNQLGNDTQRYSKKGITAYVMITYNFSGLDNTSKPITKVLTYELVQEPITLVASQVSIVENNKIAQNTILTTNDGSAKEYISIPAGNTTKFHLDTANSLSSIKDKDVGYYLNVLGAAFETNFFKHCTFSIQNGDQTGIKFEKGNEKVNEITITSPDDTLNIYAPSSYYENKTVVIISYKDENDETVRKLLNLNIVNNYTFSIKDNAEGITVTDDYYEINLSHSSEQDIADLIGTYFEHGTNAVTCELVGTSNLAKLENEKLSIGKSYATIDSDGKVVRDSIVIKMTIGGIEIKRQLKINIIPEYTFDFRALTTNTINIINGENIFNQDYIKIYYGASNKDEVLSAVYKEIFKSNILKLTSNDASISFDNGKVLKSDLTNGTKECTLTIQVCGGIATAFEKNCGDINTIIHNYEIYFSSNAELGLGEGQGRADTYPATEEALRQYKEKYQVTTTEIEITAKAGDTIDLSNYFAIFTNGNTIKTNLYAGLTNDNGNTIVTNLTVNETGRYDLVVGTIVNGQFEMLCSLNIKVTINVTE